jgi:hypothetical protein
MPYASPEKRRQAAASSMRKRRIYLSAVAANNPKALAAERARFPMRPLNELEKRLLGMPKPDREQYRAEHASVKAACVALAEQDHEALYRRLRAEVIAEATL